MNKKNLIIFYLYSFFLGFYIANGTTVLFERALGFSYSRVFTLGAVYMLMFVLFNIPAGALADIIGRKKVILLGCGALMLAAIATGASNNFTEVFLSFFLWSFGFSLLTGADEALLYDSLNSEEIYSKTWGKSGFYRLIGMALAGVLGPFLFAKNFRYPYLYSALPFLAAGVVILLFSEKAAKEKFTIKHHLSQTYEGIKIAFGNKNIFWAIGFLSLVFGAMYTFINSYQPYLQQIGFSVKTFSVILPMMFVIQALGGAISGKIFSKNSENKIFTAGFLLTAISFAILGLLNSKLNLLTLLVYSFVLGVLQPVISTYTNRYASANFRATVVSVQSMVATVFAAFLLFLFGFFSDRLGLNKLLLMLAVIVAVSGTMLMLFKPKAE
jgi:MFS family permease